MRKKHIKYYTLFIIIGLLFICKGPAPILSMPDSDILLTSINSAPADHFCCDNKVLKISFFEHTGFNFTIPAFFSFLLLYLVSIFKIFWHKWFTIFKRSAGSHYVHKIIYNFGGWNIFLAMIFYFRLGIIHPKIH